MPATYSVNDLRQLLIKRHGAKLQFLLDKFDARKFEFEIQDLWFRRFDGTAKGVYVDDGASSLSEATDWALDAIREWAGHGIDHNGNYFGEITRAWAKTGEGKDNVPACLGSVLDWCYLFSSGPSSNSNSDMYHVYTRTGGPLDLTNLYCWVFADKWRASSLKHAHAMVNITSDRGLNKKYWDMSPELGGINKTDQTHHFAGFFWFGAHVGTGSHRLNIALSTTGDYSLLHHKVLNQGDYDLGYLAADWGKKMVTNRGYLGKQIEASLR
jgi:hypothetical protein